MHDGGQQNPLQLIVLWKRLAFSILASDEHWLLHLRRGETAHSHQSSNLEIATKLVADGWLLMKSTVFSALKAFYSLKSRQRRAGWGWSIWERKSYITRALYLDVIAGAKQTTLNPICFAATLAVRRWLASNNDDDETPRGDCVGLYLPGIVHYEQ